MKINILPIDLAHPDLTILNGHLKMGGRDPRGVEIGTNSRFLTLNGRPWLPVMGEFHFSRYPDVDWRDELLKIKAGGITVVSTYIFWIHHEETEGIVNWNGSRDLHHFVEICGDCGLYVYPRIGPWVHGEARNGGFPDWLLERCGDHVRQDNPEYLTHVRRWYGEIAKQLSGLLWKDGGPVIGIQVENELVDQPGHLATLKHLTIEAGLNVPLYTVTGWGPAQIPPGDELIPVFGGYADACWDRYTDNWARECRINYFFNLLRDDNAIGTDLLVERPGGRIADLDRYPFGACELGGGMQVTYHRRAYISPDDVVALAMTKVGSGNNLQGYYMYHGGSHPQGQRTTLQETQATGYWNDYPVVSYDFQAPLGEFGQVREVYHALRSLHQFLADFGSRLAPLPANLPALSPHELDDRQTLRWGARSDGKTGFIFINNYQRMESLPNHEAVQFDLQLAGGNLRVPAHPVRIPSGMYAIWPFNFDMNGILLAHATVQPFCRIDDSVTPCYVFSICTGVEPELAFDPASVTAIVGAVAEDGLVRPSLRDGIVTFRVYDHHGKPVRVLLLDEHRTRQCWKFALHGQEHLFLSPANLTLDGNTLSLCSSNPQELWFDIIFVDGLNQDAVGASEANFRHYNFPLPEKSLQLEITRIRASASARQVRIGPQGVATPPEESAFAEAETWQVRLPLDTFEGMGEVFLTVEYHGDIARAYLGDRLIADDFYSGRPWGIGLRRFLPQVLEAGLTLKVLPLHPQAPIYIQPEFKADPSTELIRSIRLVPEYRQTVDLSTLDGFV
jgi:beta-galactosidase